MVEHPWMRAPVLANVIGLMLAALGVIITGLQIENIYIAAIGTVAFVLFMLLFFIFLSFSIRDYIDLYPTFKRRIFGIRY